MLRPIKLIVMLVMAYVPSVIQAQWYGSVDFMLPTRATDGKVTVFQRAQSTGPSRVSSTVLLDEEDLQLDFAPAGRVTIGNRSPEFGFEGSYMVTSDWNETASVFDATGLQASPFSNVGAVPNPLVDNNTSAIVNYSTELETGELNLTQLIYSGWNGNASMFYGVRYLSLEESLLYTSTNAATHNLLITTDNQIIGPQLGTLLEAPFTGGQFSFAFKVAMTYNSVDKTTVFDGVLGTGTDSSASMLSEININCLFNPAPNFSVQLGYQLLAVTDVALATSNFERSLPVLNSGFANVQTNRAVAYHSPYVGVVFRY